MIKILRLTLLCGLALLSADCYAQAPNISYATPQTYAVGTTISPLTPVNSGGSVPVNGYSVSPSLPLGLAFDKNTGVISGKPQIGKPTTNYTISAVNASGGSSAVLSVTVNVPPAPNISYGGAHVYTNAITISPVVPTNSGGIVPTQTAIDLAPPIGFNTDLTSDVAGNVYVISSSAQTLEKIPAGGGTPIILSTNMLGPSYLTVDRQGNLYVIDNHIIKKYSAIDSELKLSINIENLSPLGIAVDSAGNIYVTDNIYRIIRISPDGTHIEKLTNTFQNVFGPRAIAIDATNNIYIIDLIDNSLREIAAGTDSAVTLAIGLKNPRRIAVDAGGNIYVLDIFDRSIKRVPAGGGTPVVVASGFFSPNGVGVDAINNLYVSDDDEGVKLIGPGGYFADSPLPPGLSIDNATGIISGKPLKPGPAANYKITAYNAGGSNISTINIAINQYPLPQISYPGPKTYIINQPVTPKLIPTATNVSPAGDSYVVPMADNLINLRAMAVDAQGNTYITQAGIGTVRKISADGNSVEALAGGFTDPSGIAVDGAGNIFVADGVNNNITKLSANAEGRTIFASGLVQPEGLTIDANNNLYVINGGNATIQRIPHGGGAPVTVGPTIGFPSAITTDGAGNVYVADLSVRAIYKIPAGSTNAAVLFNTSLSNISSLAADATGNLYFYEDPITRIMELPAGGNALVAIGPTLSGAGIVNVNRKNIIYIQDSGERNIKQLVPSGGFYISPTLPAGLTFDKNTGSISGTPVVASPATDYTVTAFNIGAHNSAIINIKVLPDVDLKSLSLSAGELSPQFKVDSINYKASVSNPTTSITLTPVADDASFVIKVAGTIVTSGTASPAISLAVGANVIPVTVTAADGVTIKTYTITVTRVSTNALLSSLKITPATGLTSTSGPGYANYTTSVPNSETSLTVTAIHQDANSAIKINGVTVPSGTASPAIPLNVGANTITVAVTAQDGATTKTYTITATRAGSSIATLSNIALNAGTLNPAFATATTGYTTIVPNATSSIKITPTVTDANATIKVNGTTVASGAASPSIALAAGNNIITTVVTAQDGTTTQTYTVTVTRAAAVLSTNALLTSIKINPSTGLTTTSGPGYANYTTSAPNSETSLTVTPTHQDVNSTIKVNGVTVASGTASPAIPLNVGNNLITVVVTAQDGATTKTYIITATRAASPVATLSNLALSTGTVSPAFASATTGYTAIVPYVTSSIKITPTVTDANATIKVNGVTVGSGSASPGIPLAVGTNAITTVVTAQDGTTTKTYKTTVTRAAAGLSTNALLTSLKITPATGLTTVSGPGYANYKTSVPNSETSLTVTATHQDANSTIKINGVAVASGTASPAIPLNVGDNVITTVVTAQDGATTKTYIITATRAAAGLAAKYTADNQVPGNGLTVHQGLSPNGDGDNDVLIIDGITNYPDNTLQVMNRGGELVYETKGYNNSDRVFDGHAITTGKLLQAGTYFYSLDYKDGNETKHKTGFIVLKY